MYRRNQLPVTTLERNESYSAESLEKKLVRITTNKEPIKDGSPLIYTDRNEGVLPDYNVRTDRFETAIDAMDAVSKATRAKRQGKIVPMEQDKKEGADGGTTPPANAGGGEKAEG